MTRTAVFPDDFAAGSVGAGWTNPPAGGWGGMSQVGGVLSPAVSGADSAAFRNTGTYGTAQYAKATVGTLTGTGSFPSMFAAIVNGDTATGTCYVGYLNVQGSGSGPKYQIYRVDASIAFVLIAESADLASASAAAGDYVVLENDGNGFLRLYHKEGAAAEKLVLCCVDKTYTGGRPGVAVYRGTGDTATFEAFEGGTYAAPAAGSPEYVDLFGSFETSTDGTALTDAILAACFVGQFADRWRTVSAPPAQTYGATPEFTIAAAAVQSLIASLSANGTTVAAGGTRGIQIVHSADRAIQMRPNAGGVAGGAPIAVAFDFRWNGANQNSSPRDVFFLRSDPTGNYQGIQVTDDPTTPNIHVHWQPGGTGIGNPVNIQKNHWYTLRIKHVEAPGTLTLEVFDRENNYALVGTSTGSVTGAYTGGATTVQMGLVQYFAGSGQNFQFDNFKVNLDGRLPEAQTYAKNAVAKIWSSWVTNSDGKKWSNYPAGDKPGLTGLVFPNNASSGGDIRMRWNGAARLSRTSCTVLCRVNYSAQADYYAKTWFDGTPGTWDGGAWSVGAHPYPTDGSYNPVTGGTSPVTGTTHYYEIAGLGGGDFIATPDPGGVPQGNLLVTKGVWKREAFKIETISSTLRHTFRPDVESNPSFSIVQDYASGSIGSPSSPAFYFGASSWRANQPSAGRNDESSSCTLRGIALFSAPLSNTHCDAILALDTDAGVLAYCTANGLTSSLWYLNMNPTPGDITDKSGNGHNPSWDGNGIVPTLWTA